MKVRRLDQDFDYIFGMSKSNFIKDNDAIIQTIRTKLLLLRGEWWENLFIGLPLFESIIGQYNLDNIKLAANRLIRNEILKIEGINSIENLSIEVNERTRQMKIFYNVSTIYGQAESEVIL